MTDPLSTNQPSTHALAIVSLVLGILGMTPVLPLVGSIGAIVSGVIARREISVDPERYTGEGIARAGLILGWIGVVLLVCVLLAIVAFLVPARVDIFRG